MGHLLLLHHVALPEDLHGVHVASVDLLNQSDLSKRSFPNHFDRGEIINPQSGSLQSQELRLLGSVLVPLLSDDGVLQSLVAETFLQPAQSLLSLSVLRYQVAVLILQGQLSLGGLVQSVTREIDVLGNLFIVGAEILHAD